MRVTLLAALCCSWVAAGAAAPHERVGAPRSWTKGAAVKASEPLGFTFALSHTPAQRQWLRETVEAVSQPGSPKYGQHLTLDQVVAATHMDERQAAGVVSALQAAGFESVAVMPSGDFITARASAGVAAEFFSTPFCTWTHDVHSGVSVTRACNREYSLPPTVGQAVDFVSGLLHFPSLSVSPKVMEVKVAAPLVNNVQECRESYNTTGVTPKAHGSNSSVCFTQFLHQWYSPTALQAFEKAYVPKQAGQTIARKVGPSRAGEGTEANLDAQYLLAMAAGVKTWVWSNTNTNSVNNQEPWVEFLSNVSSSADVPLLFSISYGEGESTLTQVYMNRADEELQKIAARGITVLSASGDNGSGCTSDKFDANFPAALPHITSVGGTAVCTRGTRAAGFSSGGFSNHYARPAWQTDAVTAFLSQHSVLPDPSMYNSSGRAYPDVAACGNVQICSEFGCGMPVAGTSCASPIFAGVMGLVNDARLAAGKSPMGFLSPALYKAWGNDKSVFTDVTGGRTEGCRGQHWEATHGWDPATGLGTPVYTALVKNLLKY